MDLRAFFGVVLLSVTPAFSQENITEKGKTTLETGTSYLTNTRNYHSLRNTIKNFTDTKVYHIGGRYGLSENLETHAKVSFLDKTNRVVDSNLMYSRTPESLPVFSALQLGVNYRIAAGDNFDLFSFADASIYPDVNLRTDHLVALQDYTPSVSAGFKIYGTFDPIIFSSSVGFKLRSPQTVESNEVFDMGEVVFFKPSIGVKLNDKTTITGGMPVYMVNQYTVNGEQYRPQAALSDLEFGLSHKLDQDTTLSFTVVSGLVELPDQNSLDLHFKLTKDFDSFFN